MKHIKDLKSWEEGINQVICGDCLDLMKLMPNKCVDLVITDPPYGVGMEYDYFNDDKKELKNLVDKIMPELLRVGKIVLITCGNSNQTLYPKPDWTLAWVYRGGANRCNWGFNTWQPILAYGKCPYMANNMGARADTIWQEETPQKNGHPCPKPIKFWSKLLLRGSVKQTDLIFDPFMGSWTTARACKDLNRRFIGAELSEKYCEIGEQRLRQNNLL